MTKQEQRYVILDKVKSLKIYISESEDINEKIRRYDTCLAILYMAYEIELITYDELVQYKNETRLISENNQLN